MGDFIDKKDIKDPQNLGLWYKVNDVFKQQESTNLMLYQIPKLIEHCSSIMKLEEGDLILTGPSRALAPPLLANAIRA